MSLFSPDLPRILFPNGLIGYMSTDGAIQGISPEPPKPVGTTLGPGSFSLPAGTMDGSQGIVDMTLVFGAPSGGHGPQYLLWALYDAVTSYGIWTFVDQHNQIIFYHQDADGTYIASTTQVGPVVEGTQTQIIYAWDSTNQLVSPYYTIALIDNNAPTWNDEPKVPFTAFTPTDFVVGLPWGSYSTPFNGKIKVCHLGASAYPVNAPEGVLVPYPWPGPGPGPGPRPWPPRPKPRPRF
jgi:hypothetical protein